VAQDWRGSTSAGGAAVAKLPFGLHREHKGGKGLAPGKLTAAGTHRGDGSSERPRFHLAAVTFIGGGEAPMDGGRLWRFLRHRSGGRRMRHGQIEGGEGRGWSSPARRVGGIFFTKSGMESWAPVAGDGEWIAGGEDRRQGCSIGAV
jgi:hypothetical protein